MLHTKFRQNRITGSGVEDFEGFLPYMNVASWSCELHHVSMYQKLTYKIWLKWPSGF